MAAATEVANLQVMVSANTKAVTEGLNKVSAAVDYMTAQAKRNGDETSRSLSRISGSARVAEGAIKGMVSAFAGVSAVRVFGAAIDQVLERAKLLQDTRLAPDLAAGLFDAARANNVAPAELTKALSQFSEVSKKTKDDAEEFYKALSNIGPTFVKAFESAPTQSERLRVVSDALKSTTDEVKRAQLAQEAFGTDSERITAVFAGGRAALQQYADAARATGTVIDKAMIAKAQQADRVLSDLSTVISANLRAAIVDLAPTIANMATSLGGLAQKAAAAMAAFGGVKFNTTSNLRAEMEERRREVDNLSRHLAMKNNPDLPDSMRGRVTDERDKIARQAAEIEAELAKRGEFADVQELRDVAAGSRVQPRGEGAGKAFTGRQGLIPKAQRAGRDPLTDEDRAEKRLEQYIKSLERQDDVLRAQVETFGKSNAEKRAAVELARAENDLALISTERRAKLTAQLREAVTVGEAWRARLEQMRAAQEAVNDAARFFADSLTSALEAASQKGAKLGDILKDIGRQLASATLRGALAGEGPFAGLFGTKGKDGGAGGLIGTAATALFRSFIPARAGGGPVNAGQAYRVGEVGTEFFIPSVPGRIAPASTAASRPASNVFNISVVGATGNAEVERMVARGVAAGVRQSVAGEQERFRQYDLRVA